MSKKPNIHFSSENQAWSTPQDFYDKLHKEFNFDLDPCTNGFNSKCTNFFTIKDDGLSKNWGGHKVFMNPPYGREIKHWIKKAYEESLKENTLVVCLIPSRTDTSYWHDYIFEKAHEIRYIRGRLKFGGNKNPAPFPSAVIVFKKGESK